jgi:2-dehydro-3-deoxy-D-arabinonate dehydratase
MASTVITSAHASAGMFIGQNVEAVRATTALGRDLEPGRSRGERYNQRLMKLCRFTAVSGSDIRIGLVTSGYTLVDVTHAGVPHLTSLIERPDAADELDRLARAGLPAHPLDRVQLLTPVESQEVWAAGVTYLRSKEARMEESEFSASAYDRVYDAVRPEIFFKSLPDKVVGPGDAVGIRRDARWNVPEPELALVISSSARIVGFTIGNDMSSRDIEGENLLYLPQAKIYTRSCALGPWIVVGVDEDEVRQWSIGLEIERRGMVVFAGETRAGQIKRTFAELVDYLFRSQQFPNGVVLLTGAGVVPPDSFTLEADDRVRITIAGIGTLENPVAVV